MATESFIPASNRLPFHTTEDGFCVYEGSSDGHYVCTSPGAVTYRGDLGGCARFIERMRSAS